MQISLVNSIRFQTPLIIAATCVVTAVRLSHGDEIRFNSDIRPILVEHCLQCHGPDAASRQADLRLDLEDEATRTSIVPGKADDSELYQRIVSDDPDLQMPPPESGKSLSAQQVEAVRQWIQQGARYQGHWAFEPIRQPRIPPGHEQASDIDRFVLAGLESVGLSMSPPVNRQQLIRRATFDLTGLPPTWQEVQRFLADDSSDAFAKLIDRLLDSPAYGQRWGRHWLDIARYADTHGGSAIGYTRFPFSYTYRNFVIRAFNEDLPYDQFVMQQLAADQLGLPENDPALAAMGFLTVGMQYRNPHDRIDDQIDVVTRGLLGLTVACARCHDHKYDAIPTTDYYSLYATLGTSRAPELLPLVGQPDPSEALQSYQQELRKRQLNYDDISLEQSAVLRGRLRMQVGLYLRELAKGAPEQDLDNTFLSYRTDDVRPMVLERWREYLAAMSEDDPVFGPWVRLDRERPQAFSQRCVEIVQKMRSDNGDQKPEPHKLAANAPRWNPRVLDALTEHPPASMIELAEVYGNLFADLHQQWLQELISSSLEARDDSTVVPDEDPKHSDLNSSINRQLRWHLYGPDTPTAMPDKVAVKLLNRTVKDNITGRRGAIQNLHLNSPGSPPRSMALQEESTPRDFYVFRRGNPLDRGEAVKPRFLSALSRGAGTDFPERNRRLALAQAIVDVENPLARRVIVNWVWQHHFGQGLVRTPDNFGIRGSPPTHPDLLDHLSMKLLQDGWSLKKLHRRIMLTDVYQQSAVENAQSRIKDPDNLRLWRMPRRRLDLESMRDAMLFVSGELDPQIGGRAFELDSDPIVPRRSVYAFVNRDFINDFASTFDGANPNACTAKRPTTNVPQQTLFALNSRFIQDRASAFASRGEIASAESDADRVGMLYRIAFGRDPAHDEMQIALEYVGQQQDSTVWERLAHVLLAANEFVYVD